MINKKNILIIAKSVISTETDAIAQLQNRLTDDFSQAIQIILSSEGRLIVAGVGKSANIANKMVATFNSTGQPSIFLHASDAMHGDLGNIQKNDNVICISKSGNTEEIKMLVTLVKNLGNKIISIICLCASDIGSFNHRAHSSNLVGSDSDCFLNYQARTWRSD